MSLNSTPSSDRIHIGIFGRRNAGKSSIINAITSQDLSIVSQIAGTTTDPVQKAMELLPIGPVVIIDTPGIDDSGELGDMRVKKSYRALNKSDIAVLVVNGEDGFCAEDMALVKRIHEKNIPYVIAVNKSDISGNVRIPDWVKHTVRVSAKTGEGIHELKETIAHIVPSGSDKPPIVSDLIKPGDFVILVVPIDESAPKGRLILPQQQTLRDILDTRATALVCQPPELLGAISSLAVKPALVITDSQAFAEVARTVPEDIPLTSFSILMVRHKGQLDTACEGAKVLDRLSSGDRVLICEGCTHHRQCADIGTVKLPRLIRRHTGLDDIRFDFTSGTEFPDDVSAYRLIIHCGGCMLNDREMMYRINSAVDQNVPITNYGIAISHMNGILARTLEIFKK